MKQYLELLEKIKQEGIEKSDRTGTGTKSIFGYQMRFDLSKGFPILTTKRVPFGLIKSELLWFIKGDTNIRYLLQHNNHIWDEWAFKRYVESADYTGEDMTDFGRRSLQDSVFKEVYEKELETFCQRILNEDDFAAKYGELGNIYGSQWRHWKTSQGETIDQLAQVIEMLKTSPDSRRLLVSAWNPEDVPSMALPPCHTMFQFYVADGKLSCQLYQRSADVFLGVPFNIASYALLTHLYLNHLEQVDLQLSRETYELPQLVLKHPEKSLYDLEVADVVLEGYECHPTIKAPIAV